MSAGEVTNGVGTGDDEFVDVKEWKDETGKTVFQHLSEGFAGDDEAVADGAVLRYRAPFLRVIKHDAYFDAFNLVVESMLNRRISAIRRWDMVPADHHRHACLRQEDHEWREKITRSFSLILLARPSAWERFPISCESEKGRRPKQEDRMLAMPTLSLVFPEVARSDVALMAVFDGHGGAECSAYGCAHLPAEFVRALNATPTSLEDALKHAFERLDVRLSARCEHERWRSGTTAVAAAIDPKNIVIAWIGDSAAYEEARRVEEDGGQLLYIQGELRVNGVLNLTRALGDIGGRPMISPKADTIVIEREMSQYLLLLTCDGISELFSNDEVMDMVRAFVAKHGPEKFYDLSDHLCRAAMAGGSIDNVTCVSVFLRPPKDLWDLLDESADN
ncbi:unnamed protein product [Nippostrongylus brasiliensis]|uniref:PPM-type phosphatase domain-containing protein n=1 Tax=Nippostrongylus brasiliensis TaxID=27835 RepID=A0A0N4Y0R1_NIPBR|nr:unnamed protein product [Nippostrongylus brasiliensis]